MLSRGAPNVTLNVLHMNAFPDPAMLSSGQIDLILGDFPSAPNNLMMQSLFKDTPTFVARKNYPIFMEQHVKFKELLEYEFVMVSFMQDPQANFLDHLFKRANLKKRVAVTVPHAMSALQALVNTDLITHTCCLLAKPFAVQAGLKLISKPSGAPKIFTEGEFQAKQYWHKAQQADAGYQWLRQQIKKVASELQ